MVVIFAQILTDPNAGKKYFVWFVGSNSLSHPTLVLYSALFLGGTFVLKNTVAAFEVFFQNFSIQNMSYRFKNDLLSKYTSLRYDYFLTRNSSFGLQVISSDAENAFSRGMISIASILTESIIFVFLIAMIVILDPFLATIVLVGGLGLYFIIVKQFLPLFYDWGLKLRDTGVSATKNLLQFFHAFKEIILLGKAELL